MIEITEEDASTILKVLTHVSAGIKDNLKDMIADTKELAKLAAYLSPEKAEKLKEEKGDYIKEMKQSFTNLINEKKSIDYQIAMLAKKGVTYER